MSPVAVCPAQNTKPGTFTAGPDGSISKCISVEMGYCAYNCVALVGILCLR